VLKSGAHRTVRDDLRTVEGAERAIKTRKLRRGSPTAACPSDVHANNRGGRMMVFGRPSRPSGSRLPHPAPCPLPRSAMHENQGENLRGVHRDLILHVELIDSTRCVPHFSAAEPVLGSNVPRRIHLPSPDIDNCLVAELTIRIFGLHVQSLSPRLLPALFQHKNIKRDRGAAGRVDGAVHAGTVESVLPVRLTVLEARRVPAQAASISSTSCSGSPSCHFLGKVRPGDWQTAACGPRRKINAPRRPRLRL
jgi:hypothetical protein